MGSPQEFGQWGLPARGRRRFLPRSEFLALGQGLPTIDPTRFRADVDDMADPYADDPYERGPR